MHEIEMLMEASKSVKPSERMIRHHAITHNHMLPASNKLNVSLIVEKFDEISVLYRLGLPIADILNQLNITRSIK
jgi:hypothetical protein